MKKGVDYAAEDQTCDHCEQYFAGKRHFFHYYAPLKMRLLNEVVIVMIAAF